MPTLRSSVGVASFLLLTACQGGADDTGPAGTGLDDVPRGDCNPVDPEHCMMPFPSSFFLTEDAGTGSGYRVDFGPASLPKDKTGLQMDPTTWNRRDGFPVLGPLYVMLPGARVDSPGTVQAVNLFDTDEDDVTTVLVDVETGERVAHYVEREAFPDDPLRAALILHPAVPLAHARRYAVGIRRLLGDDGEELPGPEAFAALRDGVVTEDSDLERQRAGYDAVIFPALEAAGFARGETQMAWDFVTESESGSLAMMNRIREVGLAQIPPGGPPYTLDNVRDYDCDGSATVGRKISGKISVPLFLDNDQPGAFMVLDDDALPVQNGTAEVPFTIAVPCSVLEDPRPSLLIQGGHGLFGSHTDFATNPWADVADRAHGIVFGTTWRGLGSDDYTGIAIMMATDPSDFHMIPDQLLQGHFEALAMARLMQGDLAGDAALMVDGVSLVDTSQLTYYGVSLGTVVGGAQVAMSPEIDRAVMQIAGMPFSGILTRSSAFGTFLDLIGAKFNDPADVSMIVPLAQMLWQPAESGGWSHSLVDGAAQGGRDGRRFLIQVGIGDDTVTSIGGATYARSVGARLLEPAPREVWGVPAANDPMSGSGLLEWDYGYTENPAPAPQDLDPDPHWMVPGEESAKQQIVEFLLNGDLSSRCDGVCDPD